MALKSKEWFYKQCLHDVKRVTRFAHLAQDLLEKGIGQKDKTRGHVTQAIGATQQFLDDHPEHRATIQATDPTLPLDPSAYPKVRDDFKTWLKTKHGPYGRASYGYD